MTFNAHMYIDNRIVAVVVGVQGFYLKTYK